MISTSEMCKEEIYSRDEVFACSDIWVETKQVIFVQGGNIAVLLEKLEEGVLIVKECYEVLNDE